MSFSTRVPYLRWTEVKFFSRQMWNRIYRKKTRSDERRVRNKRQVWKDRKLISSKSKPRNRSAIRIQRLDQKAGFNEIRIARKGAATNTEKIEYTGSLAKQSRPRRIPILRCSNSFKCSIELNTRSSMATGKPGHLFRRPRWPIPSHPMLQLLTTSSKTSATCTMYIHQILMAQWRFVAKAGVQGSTGNSNVNGGRSCEIWWIIRRSNWLWFKLISH